MKKNRRKYYIIIILLILYLGAMIFYFIYPSFKKNHQKTYLMIDTYVKWKNEGKGWENILSSETDLYNWQLFDVYIGREAIGKRYLLYNQGWLLFDQEKEPLGRENVDIFAIRSNQKYQVAKIEEEEIDEENFKYVEKLLEQEKISDRELTTSSMFSYDIDGDGEKEKVFVISNLFETEIAPKTIFNFIFTVKGDTITIINRSVDSLDKLLTNCKMSLSQMVDVNGDGVFEFITSCGYYNNPERCYEMFSLEGKEYEKVKACRKE